LPDTAPAVVEGVAEMTLPKLHLTAEVEVER
jgi:hypothetical protein